ncbi:agamous-like MADS-box protein AGL80 [Punica granatum]|uniref:Uncharacterized protein n=2 Tax=Punica granatum TaxID=22663 RepID=A0A2I0IVZ5_PUNGR|nr:agamous-like MADS-box protein AGL80 [Punica granatum]PKI48167.1 hypothetical protein CRG98_031432 [Punica granatum]
MRKKVKLAFIIQNSSRKATFNKRKSGLLKMVNQLSILCGVPACAIIYGENGSKPGLWPPSPDEVRQVISKFLLMPAMEQTKKMLNQESFLRQRIAKAEEQLNRQRRDNREREVTDVMYRGLGGLLEQGWLLGLSMLDLNDLGWAIDKTLHEIVLLKEKMSQPKEADNVRRMA